MSVLIIAEAGVNHNGSLELAKNLADAAKAAVYLHGEAGDKATAQKGERAMLPSDIIEQLLIYNA